METNIDIYSRLLDLFETIFEALEHIGRLTLGGDFETALVLLNDIQDAITETQHSSGVLLTRLEKEATELDEKHRMVVANLYDLIASYENVNIEVVNAILRNTLAPSLRSLRNEIVNLAGAEISS